MKILYIVALIVAVVFLYYLISKKSAAAEDQLPEKFAPYQLLDSSTIIRSGIVQMSLLLESKKNIELFLTSQNNIIVSGFTAEKEKSFIKIAPDGKVSDTLTLMSRPEDMLFLKGFIVNTQAKQYYRWSFNGAKTPISISAQNSDFDWDDEKQDKQLAYIVKHAAGVWVDYKFDSPVPEKIAGEGPQTTQGVSGYAIVTYMIGEECFQFYTTLNISKYFSSAYLQEMLWNNLFKRISHHRLDGEIISTPNLNYRYFHKLKPEKVRFSGGGGNAPGFTKRLYPGYLFTDVVFRNDTIKLKELMYLDEDWHASAIAVDGQNIGALYRNKVQPIAHMDGYLYYTNNHLQYALFTNNEQKLYLIK